MDPRNEKKCKHDKKGRYIRMNCEKLIWIENGRKKNQFVDLFIQYSEKLVFCVGDYVTIFNPQNIIVYPFLNDFQFASLCQNHFCTGNHSEKQHLSSFGIFAKKK